MAPNLMIKDIKLMPPRLDEENKETGERHKWVDIEITVTNPSDKNLYAISSLRSLNYDPATKTLRLGLSEPEPIPHIKHRLSPALATIKQNQTVVLHLSIPLIIRHLRPSSGLGMEVETLDISHVERVICDISFHTAPFYPKPKATSEELMRDLRVWGKPLKKEFARKIPQPDIKKGGEEDALD
jgi:hypothetical protein